MSLKWYKTSRRVVALGFIGLIILGNIWLMSLFTGSEPPAWTAHALFVCVGVVTLGGLGLIPHWLFGTAAIEKEHEN